MDSCHAGELDVPITLLAAPPAPAANVRTEAARGLVPVAGDVHVTALLEELFAELRRGNGAAVITAAGGLQVAYEGVGTSNGLFTSQVIEGLRSGSADANRDGSVSVSELRDFVVNRVQELSGGKQRPTARRDVLEFDFAVVPPVR
jgi:hypothetical protein